MTCRPYVEIYNIQVLTWAPFIYRAHVPAECFEEKEAPLVQKLNHHSVYKPRNLDPAAENITWCWYSM